MSHREETPGQTWHTLEGLRLSTGLGTAGISHWGQRRLGVSAENVSPGT